MPENQTPDASLKTAVEELLPEVYYPSESDEPIEFIELNLPPEAEPLNERSAGEFLATKRNREVEELTVDDFSRRSPRKKIGSRTKSTKPCSA